jgi:hypothetical protein
MLPIKPSPATHAKNLEGILHDTKHILHAKNLQGLRHGLLASYKHLFLNVRCRKKSQSFKVQGTFKKKCLVGAAFFKGSFLGIHSIKFQFYLIRHLVRARAFE